MTKKTSELKQVAPSTVQPSASVTVCQESNSVSSVFPTPSLYSQTSATSVISKIFRAGGDPDNNNNNCDNGLQRDSDKTVVQLPPQQGQSRNFPPAEVLRRSRPLKYIFITLVLGIAGFVSWWLIISFAIPDPASNSTNITAEYEQLKNKMKSRYGHDSADDEGLSEYDRWMLENIIEPYEEAQELARRNEVNLQERNAGPFSRQSLSNRPHINLSIALNRSRIHLPNFNISIQPLTAAEWQALLNSSLVGFKYYGCNLQSVVNSQNTIFVLGHKQ